MIKLRDYQEGAIAALWGYWGKGGGNGLIVLPTGAGKSLVIADIMRRLLTDYPALRVICVTHTRELITQNYQELIRLWQQAPAGIYSAGVGRRDTHSRILFCGVQSVFNKVEKIGKADLILVDEAHLIPRNAQTMYGQFIERMLRLNPDMRIAGLTATDYRLDSGRLTEGEDAIFDEVVYDAKVLDLIEQGYLSKLISKASITASMDLKGIGTRAGDYIAAQVEARAMEGDLIKRAVDELVALAGDRRSWLVFCVTIAHAVAVAEALKARGIACEAMDGTMNKGARSSTIQRFRDGQLRCLTSVNVLSIGFNVPQVDVIALMRPTKSAGLYIQQVGRGFRRAEGKENCLILDFAKVVRMHGPVDAVTVHSPKKKGKGEGDGEALARAKICPNCATYAAPSAPSCMTCGFEWPVKDEAPKHDETADDSAGILSTEIVKPKMAPVVDWKFYRHEKPGSPDSVRVTYLAGLSEFREWLGFEHEGYPQRKAHQWWALHGGQAPFPRKVTDALLRVGELRRPTAIAVRKNGQYFDIVNRDFQEMETAS